MSGIAWRLFQLSFLYLLPFVFAGCFHEVLLDTESLTTANDQTIVVSTIDGNRYKFSGGDYKITPDSNGAPILLGQAKKYRANTTQFEKFEGAIPVNDIEKVSTSETTIWLYVSIVVTASLIGFALLFAGMGPVG